MLSKILNDHDFRNTCWTGDMSTETRLASYRSFKNFEYRILVSTKLAGRGIDVEKVNVVINYDFPDKADEYLHRVGRAGRFGTKGLAISFISNSEESKIMDEVQLKFSVSVPPLPEVVDTALYMN